MKRIVKAHSRISELTLQPVNHLIFKAQRIHPYTGRWYTFASVLDERWGIKSIKNSLIENNSGDSLK